MHLDRKDVMKPRQPSCWRVFTAIFFTRVLVAMSKKGLRKQKSLSHSLSSVSIDVHDEIVDTNHTSSTSGVDQITLACLVKEKNSGLLSQLGGVEQIVAALNSHITKGISGGNKDLEHRREVFGVNTYQKRAVKTCISFFLQAIKDKTIVILLVCAMISFGFDIKQYGLKHSCYGGISNIFAVVLIAVVSSVSKFRLSTQFRKHSYDTSQINVQVIRDGKCHWVAISDVVVGDVILLKIGDRVPANGLFLHGYSLKLDEYSLSGDQNHEVAVNCSDNPFLHAGAEVIDGFGFMLVTSVGEKITSSTFREMEEEAPFQEYINKLTSQIKKIGAGAAAIIFTLALVYYFTGSTKDASGKPEFIRSKTNLGNILQSIVNLINAAVNIVEVTIPEGLLLALALNLTYSMKLMTNDHIMIRKLSACETINSATTICTDITGTLTMNQMKVTEVWLGKEKVVDDFPREITSQAFQLLQEGVALNTTSFVNKQNSALDLEIFGCPTEKALLSWAKADLGVNIDAVKQYCEVVHLEVFKSDKKWSGVLIRKNHEKAIQTHLKGAAEIILSMCSNYYDSNGEKEMSREEKSEFELIIRSMATKGLRCIAFAHKKVAEVPNDQQVEEAGLTLLGLVGLENQLQPGVREAVESCKKAGLKFIMITGDNIHTARAIAFECKILDPEEFIDSEAVIEGVQFRNYLPEERNEKIDRIRVMARSSPSDKSFMVQCLKERGHVVAVTGKGMIGAFALKNADIGLSMGTQGADVGKESSDMIILDNNFASVVTILRWGRCLYENIQKLIQFQLTVIATALLVTSIGFSASGQTPLTTVQLLWLNIIMETLAALALATNKPSKEAMTKPPVPPSQPLISDIMWRNILTQSLYQVIVLLTIEFRGCSIFSVGEKAKNTLVFNMFILFQVFNVLNARMVEQKRMFKGIEKNKLVLLVVVILQVAMVELLNKVANTEKLNWTQWSACMSIAAFSCVIAYLVKWIPPTLFPINKFLGQSIFHYIL
ncbi:hypothetical protein K2173_017697 [Erythroxylum novogranatense]|uniref:Calcium-transporting ATPase n=1 Tax=Erythroxylum novogranatense TaxID=1862640 RepID=A0AAV8T2Z7_9ROSI|nr:hypothetical protein K2173_017697 [Erythroxylum novogranatense]